MATITFGEIKAMSDIGKKGSNLDTTDRALDNVLSAERQLVMAASDLYKVDRKLAKKVLPLISGVSNLVDYLEREIDRLSCEDRG